MRLTSIRRRGALAWLTVLFIVLTGCAKLPSAGEVNSAPLTSVNPPQLSIIPTAPQPDSGPQQLVREFLVAAAAGHSDNFATAREYLTPKAAREWNPGTSVTVVAGDTSEEHIADGSVVVRGEVYGTLDSQGQFSPGGKQSMLAASFQLQLNERNQWRISELPAGLIMPLVFFNSEYISTPIYFASSDQEYLIPELRWLPQRNIAYYATQAVVNGPSTWLEGATFHADSAAGALGIGSVLADDGMLDVEIPAAQVSPDGHEREILAAQLYFSLRGLPGVTQVNTTLGGTVAPVEPILEPMRLDFHGPYVVQDQRILRYANGSFTEIIDLRTVGFTDGDDDSVGGTGTDDDGVSGSDSVSGSDEGQGPDGQPRSGEAAEQEIVQVLPLTQLDELAVLTASGDIWYVSVSAQDRQLLYSSPAVTGMSLDRHGWIWLQQPGQDLVTAISVWGDRVDLEIPELGDRELGEISISPEGSRLVYSVSQGQEQIIELTAVSRDSASRPQLLSGNYSTHVFAEVRDLTWLSSTSLAVLGQAESLDSVSILTIGGQVQALTGLEGAAQISSGGTLSSLHLLTQQGTLYSRLGSGWAQVDKNIDAVFFSW